MKSRLIKWLIPGLFTLAGGLIGYAYYLYMGCGNGACGIGFSPLRSVLCMAFIGWLISVILFGGKKNDEAHEEAK